MEEVTTILIIDDNQDDRENYVRHLKKAQGINFRCREFADGKKGLEAIAVTSPDCILLDYSLPGANGVDVLKHIKLQYPQIPVVMLTGQGNEIIAVQAMKEGADDYLSKSTITTESLSRCIHTAVERRDLQKKIDEQNTLLLRNETRYQQLIESVRDYAFCWLDIDGNVENWNSSAEKIIGYSTEEIVGQNFSVFYVEEDRKQGLPLRGLKCALESGQYTDEGWRLRKDGSKFWASFQIDSIRGADGRPMGFVKVTHDITERRDAELQRQKLVERLTQSNTDLERFAYVASHDMQEPVRMVINFSKIIASDFGDRLSEEGKEYLKFIIESADRIHCMIDDLLDYARLEGEARDMEPINGAEELQHVLDNLAELIREQNAQVTYDPLPNLKGNPVQFMRLLQNLVANAIKYQPAGNIPKIHIGVADKGVEWEIRIEDNGIGIDEAFTQKIFEPFRRLHGWEEIKGTGIGLAVCKKIVENHGGRITVTSVPHKGSTFFVTFPKDNANQKCAA